MFCGADEAVALAVLTPFVLADAAAGACCGVLPPFSPLHAAAVAINKPNGTIPKDFLIDGTSLFLAKGRFVLDEGRAPMRSSPPWTQRKRRRTLGNEGQRDFAGKSNVACALGEERAARGKNRLASLPSARARGQRGNGSASRAHPARATYQPSARNTALAHTIATGERSKSRA
jgi:hypothetical protein